MAVERAEFDLTLNDRPFNASMNKARASTQGLTQGVNKAGAAVGAAATSVSGLNTALGGASNSTNMLIGAAGNLATTFAAAGPVGLALAAATTGIGLLVDHFGKATEEAEALKKKAEDLANEGLRKVEEGAKKAADELRALYSDPRQDRLNVIKVEKEALRQLSEGVTAALKDETALKDASTLAELRKAEAQRESMVANRDLMDQKLKDLEVEEYTLQVLEGEIEMREKIRKQKEAEAKARATRRAASDVISGPGGAGIDEKFMIGVTRAAKAEGRRRDAEADAMFVGPEIPADILKKRIDDAKKAERKRLDDIKKAAEDRAAIADFHRNDQIEKLTAAHDITTLREMKHQADLDVIRDGATIKELERQKQVTQALESETELRSQMTMESVSAAFQMQERIAGIVVAGNEDATMQIVNLLAQQAGGALQAEGVKLVGMGVASVLTPGLQGLGAAQIAGGIALGSVGTALKVGGAAALENAGGSIAGLGGGGAAASASGGASSSAGTGSIGRGGAPTGGGGGGLTVNVNYGVGGMNREDVQRAVVDAHRQGLRRGF